MASTSSQLGITALARVERAAQTRANTITGLRPMRSEIGPVISRPNASMAVETDSTRLLCAALMANSFDSNGIIGCTQYSRAKVAKPPLNRASTVFMKAGVPFSIHISFSGAGSGSAGRGATAVFTGGYLWRNEKSI
ncbi:hypothetical protein D3C76_1174600 [compost metagenome]